MTIQEFKQKYSKGINPTDLDLLLEFILKKTKEFIVINPDYKIPLLNQVRLILFSNQLRNNKPINYIIGRKGFYGLDFKVDKHTLIPRPETEQIIDLSKKIITNNSNKMFTIIDLGTGSGNIPITLVKEIRALLYDHSILPNSIEQIYASDISGKALKTAKLNALYHQVRIKFVQGNLLDPFNKLLTTKITKPVISGCCSNISVSCNKLSNQDIKNKILLITANLPYLSTEVYNNTAQNVKKYEPKIALISGVDGLDHYRKLLRQLKKIKSSKNFSFQKTYLLLEISPEQKSLIRKEIVKIFPNAEITFHKDLAQKWRIITIKII